MMNIMVVVSKYNALAESVKYVMQCVGDDLFGSLLFRMWCVTSNMIVLVFTG